MKNRTCLKRCLLGSLLLSALLLMGCRGSYVEVPDGNGWNTVGYHAGGTADADNPSAGAPDQSAGQDSDTSRVILPDGGTSPALTESAEVTLYPGDPVQPTVTDPPVTQVKPQTATRPETQAIPEPTTRPAITLPPVITTTPKPTTKPQTTTRPQTLPPVVTTRPQTAPTPETTAAKPSPSGSLTVLELTATVSKGNKATVTVRGLPNTEYTIKVKYSSGYSSASGLKPKTSDENGVCSWTWKVGGTTKPGSYPITISDGTNTYSLTFTVE